MNLIKRFEYELKEVSGYTYRWFVDKYLDKMSYATFTNQRLGYNKMSKYLKDKIIKWLKERRNINGLD